MTSKLKAFFIRIMANKTMFYLGLLIIVCATILAFPKSIAWLPEDLGKMAWNTAHDVILYAIGAVAIFAKGHATVGDPVNDKKPENDPTKKP